MSTLKDLHNKGQSDASKGEYEPPHNLTTDVVDVFTRPSEVREQHQAENEAYNEGHEHGEEQRRK